MGAIGRFCSARIFVVPISHYLTDPAICLPCSAASGLEKNNGMIPDNLVRDWLSTLEMHGWLV